MQSPWIPMRGRASLRRPRIAGSFASKLPAEGEADIGKRQDHWSGEIIGEPAARQK
jgi:hypothetical protein